MGATDGFHRSGKTSYGRAPSGEASPLPLASWSRPSQRICWPGENRRRGAGPLSRSSCWRKTVNLPPSRPPSWCSRWISSWCWMLYAGSAPSVQMLHTAAKDIRVNSVSVFTPSTRDIRVNAANHPNGSPVGQLLSVPSPAELSYRTSTEAPGNSTEQGIHVSEEQVEGKKPSSLFSVPVHTPVTPHPHTIPTAKTTVKDIRRTAVSPYGKA